MRTVIVTVLVVSARSLEVFRSAAFQAPQLATRCAITTKLKGAPTDTETPRRITKEEHQDSSLPEYELSRQPSRRSFLHAGLVAAASLATSNVGGRSDATAAEVVDAPSLESQSATTIPDNRKPYAPLENLLPATRVKLLIDDAVDTVTLLKDGKDDTQHQLLAKCKSLLLEPHEFFQTKQEVATSKKYLDQQTWREWKKARQEETRQFFQIQTDPATELNEAFEQWGERRQFKRLRRQQLALEQSNKMRAAFNAYTNNLVFGESYALNASPAEKKRLIRQYDQLPDVTSVIRSDLDLRDLYRNQVLTAMDDAKAELEYQLRASNDDEAKMDFSELLSILREAQTSCSEWFKFVPENDLKEALAVVNAEQQ